MIGEQQIDCVIRRYHFVYHHRHKPGITSSFQEICFQQLNIIYQQSTKRINIIWVSNLILEFTIINNIWHTEMVIK